MAGFWDTGTSGGRSSSDFWGGGGTKKKPKEKGGRVQKKAELNKAVGKAEALGAGDKAKEIATKVAVNPVLKVLETLDLPRAAIVSGMGELGDALGMGQPGDKASFSDWLEQTKRHQGVGEYIQDINGGKGTGNKWADRGLGFVGDVGLDPLTYLTLGAGGVAKAGASVGAKEVARRLASKGLLGEADTVLRKGVKSISKEAAAEADVRVGARIGVGKAKVYVPGGDEVARAIGKVTGPIRGKAVDSKLAGRVQKALATVPVPESVTATEGGRAKKLVFEDAYRQARSIAQGGRQQGAAELNVLAKQYRDVDGKNLLAELEGARTGDLRAAEAAQAMRQWFEAMADRMDEATAGVRAIGRREDYAPWMMTKQFKEMIGENGQPGVRGTGANPSIAKRRTHADEGATWFGQELKGNAAQRRAQMEKIAKENFGEDFQAFLDNPWELADRYLNGVERYMTTHGTVRHLMGSPLEVAAEQIEVPIAGAAKKKATIEKGVEALQRIVEKESAQAVTAKQQAGERSRQAAVSGQAVRDFKEAGLEYRRRANKKGWRNFTEEERLQELAKDPVVVNGIEFKPVPAEEFARAIAKARRVEQKNGRRVGETVYQYKTSEYKGMKTFLSADGKTGYAVKQDGDLVSVFNVGERGAGEAAVAGGLRNDASKLDAFDEDGFLPQKYSKYGFEETGRDPWDPQYAPRGWRGETPDVVMMQQPTGPAGNVPPTILRREPALPDTAAAQAALDEVPETLTGRTPSVERAMQKDYEDAIKQAAKAKGKALTAEEKAFFKERVEIRWREKPAELRTEIDELKAQRDELLNERVTKESPEARELRLRAKSLEAKLGQVKSDKAYERLDAEYERVKAKLAEVEGQGRVGAAPAQIKKLDQEIARREQLLEDLKPKASTRPNPERAKAEKVVAELKDEFDHTMAKVEQIRADNEAALRRVEEDVASTIGRRRVIAEQIANDRRRANELFAAAEREAAAGREMLGAVAELEALAAEHTARATQAGRRAMAGEEMLRKLRTTKTETDFGLMYEMGLKEFANGHWADEWVARAATELSDFTARGGTGAFLKTFDWIQSRWKAYALLSPGFHARNFMGGAFNNDLAGVSLSSYTKFLRAHSQYKKGKSLEAITDPKVRAAYGAMIERGVLGDANIRDISDISGAVAGVGLLGPGMRRVDPTSLDNAALNLNRRGAAGVESTLRGPLFIDRMLKGASAEEAWDAVAKYHFDYDDLSRFERDVLKRVVPFYTWTRKNFPLQVESMLQQPGKYTRFVHAKRNIEMGQEEEETTPKYFGSLMAMRTGLQTKGGDRVYFAPDLPFRDLAEQFSLGTMLGQVSPIIRTPIEVATKTKTYEEFVPMSDRLQPAPSAPGWKQILPVLEKLNGKAGLPKVHKGDKGTYLMEEAQIHKINELIPLLARMRRLAPSEEKYQARQTTTAISFLTGLGFLTNTKDAQAGELARRVREVQDLNKRTKQIQEG